MPLQVSVNVEELLVQGLFRTSTEIQDVLGTRIYTLVPASNPTYPLAIVRRLGGSLVMNHHLWLDRARVQYDVWGDTKAATWRCADRMRSLFIAGQGTNYPPLGRIDGVTETIAPYYQHDPDSERFHYVGQMLVTVRPLEVTVTTS